MKEKGDINRLGRKREKVGCAFQGEGIRVALGSWQGPGGGTGSYWIMYDMYGHLMSFHCDSRL